MKYKYCSDQDKFKVGDFILNPATFQVMQIIQKVQGKSYVLYYTDVDFYNEERILPWKFSKCIGFEKVTK